MTNPNLSSVQFKMSDVDQFRSKDFQELDRMDQVPHRYAEHGHGPRYGHGEFQKLIEDVRQNGVREPIHTATYSDVPGTWVTDGHHRYAAAKAAGLQSIPVTNGTQVQGQPYLPSRYPPEELHGQQALFGASEVIDRAPGTNYRLHLRDVGENRA